MPQRKSQTAGPSTGTNSSANSAPASILRVGPAGWSYPDWAGYVYPLRRPKGFHEATYLAEFFDTIEINTSFYQPLRPDHAAQWIDRVAAANRLGAVLLQFPFSFHRTAETVAYLSAVIKRFADYPLVVEVRHASWDSPETLELLHTSGVSFCNIDQPIIGRSLGPAAQATSAVGYVRLHGRRYDTWFSDDARIPAHERYNYLYSAEELAPWVARVLKVTERARETFVVANNHFQGKSVVNALQLINSLTGSKVKVPEPLRRQYPQLEAIADTPPAEPMLFPLGSGSKDVMK